MAITDWTDADGMALQQIEKIKLIVPGSVSNDQQGAREALIKSKLGLKTQFGTVHLKWFPIDTVLKLKQLLHIKKQKNNQMW